VKSSGEIYFLNKAISGNLKNEDTVLFKYLNWTEFFKRLVEWGIAPYIYTIICNNEIKDDLPEEFINSLKNFYHFASVRNSILLLNFHKICNLLSTEGIHVIPIKGIAFLLYYYDDPSMRFTTDIDVVLKKEDIPSAVRVLKNNGYREWGKNVDWHYAPLVDENNIQVELHSGFKRNCNDEFIQEIFTHANSVDWKGSKILVPSVYHLLVIQAFSSILPGQFGQGSLIKCCVDFIEGIKKTPEFSWSKLFSIAEENKISNAVYLVLKFLTHVFHYEEGKKGIEIFKSMKKDYDLADSVFGYILKDEKLNFDRIINVLYKLLTERNMHKLLKHVSYAHKNPALKRARFRKLSPSSVIFTWKIARLLNFER